MESFLNSRLNGLFCRSWLNTTEFQYVRRKRKFNVGFVTRSSTMLVNSTSTILPLLFFPADGFIMGSL